MPRFIDVDGAAIHESDRVRILDSVESTENLECIILAIISQDEVQVLPVGEGSAFITAGENTKLVHSFLEDLESIATDEEFLELMAAAEGRAGLRQQEAKEKKATRKGSSTKASKTPKKVKELDLGDLSF